MKYYIADTHFGHKSIIDFDNRPFKSVEEMDRVLIENWNETVDKTDEVYVVGDFALCAKDLIPHYLEQLNGKKYLVLGNHDRKFLKCTEAVSQFESIEGLSYVIDEGQRIILCHYPLAEWSGYYRDFLHFYGHVHNSDNKAHQFMKTEDRAFNVGCMLHDYRSVIMKQLLEGK